MLVKNNFERTKAIGDLYLIPGVNRVDSKKWDSLMKGSFGGPIAGLIEDGELEVVEGGASSNDDSVKLSIKLISETYDLDLLNEWIDGAKGRLKGAIAKQIEKLELETE